MTDFMRIRRYIVETIAASGNHPVTFPPTRKLAEKFGVSQPTALRVIRALMEEGYLIPCRGGGSMSLPHTHFSYNPTQDSHLNIFGLLAYQGTLSYDDLYFTYLSSAMSKEIMHRDSTFCTKSIYVETPSLLGKTARQENLSGLILLGAESHILPYASQLNDSGLPVVSFMRRIEGLSSIYDDLEERCRTLLLRLFAEQRTHVVIVCWADDYYRQPLEAGIAAACNQASVPRGQIIVLDPLDASCEQKVKEMLDFGTHIEGAIFYPMHAPIYKLLQTHEDLDDGCRIVCGSYAVYQTMNFSGYVIENDFETGARALTDALLQKLEKKEHKPLHQCVNYTLSRYHHGRKVEELTALT